jgi:tetratricopeptide (TPR) repeat protein
LDDWAACAGDRQRRAWLLGVSRLADPDQWRNGLRDPAVWDDSAELARRVSGEQARKQSPQLLAVLGARLRGKEGEELLKGAWDRHPGDFWVNCELGNALMRGKKPGVAVGYYRAALALRPGTAAVHYNLGLALGDQGQVAEAIGEYRRAVEIEPNFAIPHNNLGLALRARGQVAEAVAEYHKAIELDPNLPMPHANLGNALYDQHKFAEAVAEYKKALELDPNIAMYHNNLGSALRDQGRVAEAVGEYRRAIELDPELALPHNGLANALYDQHKFAEAVAEYRKAIDLDPKDARPHAGLGMVLLQQGQFPEALRATQRCLDLLPPSHTSRPTVSRFLRQCQQMQALDQKLAAVLKGEAKTADALEQVGLAGVCLRKKRYANAARFYNDAFAARPELANDLQAAHRYNAACVAVLAAAGQGEDAELGDKERARLRQQALGWLRADLALLGKPVENGTPQQRATAQKTLQHWLKDADLAGVRDPAALDKLPGAERDGWKNLWADVSKTTGDVR